MKSDSLENSNASLSSPTSGDRVPQLSETQMMREMLSVISDMHSMMKERQGSHWQAAPTSTSHSTSADVRSSQIRESRSPDSPITQNERPSTQSKTEPHPKSLPAKGADAQVHGKTFKDFRFGLNGEQVVRENTSAANYDYRLKYPQDKRYHELDEEARVWWVYLDEAAAFDNDMVGELGDSLDILLVFAGLFSAVLTTFVAQTSQSLSQDYSQLSSSYLSELTALMRAGSNMTALSNVPTTNTSFSPAISDFTCKAMAPTVHVNYHRYSSSTSIYPSISP
ncbi:hypothetical protein LENED_009851 [Lentinula edodes]|uniref:DUF6535 domain-containing protein n=1 Tax=Lentinula edodes TaxID=5353 RepID=A0A1Q3EL46_LENED|nr:hypothetical protein LENED_009851 [Lentinula edodes]